MSVLFAGTLLEIVAVLIKIQGMKRDLCNGVEQTPCSVNNVKL